MITQNGSNEFSVSTASDLTAVIVTNLYNTGDPSDRYTTKHNGAATVHIPQQTIFTDTYAGQHVSVGSFDGVRAIFQGQHSSFFEAGRTYTVGELMRIDEFRGKGYWNFTLEHGSYGIGGSNYTDLAYVYGTHNFVLDQSTQIIVGQDGNISVGQYEVRLNKDENGMIADDFDFSGGGFGSKIFNYIHSSDIEINGRSVNLVYDGAGLTGSGYSHGDLRDYLSSGGIGGANYIQKFLAWRTQIIPDLEKSGIIVNGKDAVIIFATGAYIDANLEVNPGFLEEDGVLENIVDLVGVHNAAEFLEKYDKSCFGSEVLIDMWPLDPDLKPGADGIYDQEAVCAKVWKKPIEQIRVGDLVVSFDDNGNLVPGPVTRTFQNNAKILLNFHGTRVTPGHVYYRPDSKKSYKYETLIDVLRDDGVIKQQDGTLIRAATNAPVDSSLDGFVQAVTGTRKTDGSVDPKDAGRIRLGTRFIVGVGKTRKSFAVADLIKAGGGVVGDDEMIRVGDGEPMPFLWEFGDTLPKPEDFVLACSGTTLEDIYRAAEWESQGPRLPAPIVLDRGPVQPLKGATLSAMPRNEPLEVVHYPLNSQKL